MAENWNCIYTTDKEYQVDILRDLLENESIEVFILPKKDSMYPVGYYELRVQPQDEEKARGIVEKSGL
jgi:hypothetical protein